MNNGIIIYFVSFILAFILYIHILRCIYVKKKVDTYKYERTKDDKRLKHPLWLIILFTIMLFIPIGNLFVFIFYIFRRLANYYSEERNPYYVKSIFTKEF